MSFPQRLTDERDTRRRRSISLTEHPSARNWRARRCSCVFTRDNIPSDSDGALERPAGIEPATRGWKPLVIAASLRARRYSVAGVDPYAWPTESDAFALVPALSLAY